MQTMTMKLGNDITIMELERTRIEQEKNTLMAETEENALKKTEETTEQGQIIMTINNLYINLEKRCIPTL